ncbi:MAG: folylpolyglutamate synthase/dihydrofolate synthase family protein [Chthoniobacterales bacterium]
MNYRDALAWLYGTQTFGFKLGLDSTRCLLAAVGDPQQKLKFLHIAGTNGKGSTGAMIDAMLRASGRRTALYTSPHLVDFRERLRLDGAMIPEAAAAEGLTLLREVSSGWESAPTFFEIATVLAAWWFDREGAEFVVWETGMGGRLDATNAVIPLVSVITPIGMDHHKWLGETLAEIAAEKAGIIKSGIPAVTAPQREEARAVIEAKARAVGSSLTFVDAPMADCPVALPGEHQRWNAALAVAALAASGLHIDKAAQERGLAQVEWLARFQRRGENLVIDGAHNIPAMEALVSTWRATFGAIRAHLIFGVLRDKDAAELLCLLRSIADEVWLVPVGNPRAIPPEELRPLADAAGFPVVYTTDLSDAVTAARASGGPVLVTGSLFLAGEFLALLDGGAKPLISAQ